MFIYNESSPEIEVNLMCQSFFSYAEFEKYRKKTRKGQFLEEIETILLWKELTAAIEPFYAKPEGVVRRLIGIERMLRIRFIQHWFNLSDPAAEQAFYDSLFAPLRGYRSRLGASAG